MQIALKLLKTSLLIIQSLKYVRQWNKLILTFYKSVWNYAAY